MARQTEEVALVFRVFLLYAEPAMSFVGAYYAFFQPQYYLHLTHAPTTPQSGVPMSTKIALSQLANMYLYFGISEALVLRTSRDLRVWRVFVIGLLIGDFGHLFCVHPLGLPHYWNVKQWNAIDWGNQGFVYLGALIRICFLLSPLGLPTPYAARWTKPSATPRRSTRRIKPTPKIKA